MYLIRFFSTVSKLVKFLWSSVEWQSSENKKNDFASKNYTQSEILFLVAQSTIFMSKKHKRSIHQKYSQAESHAQFTSSSKFCGTINPEIEPIKNDQPNKFQKPFEFIKRREELSKPNQVSYYEISDIEILRKFLNGYHATFCSCANLLVSLKAMQQSSSESQSAVTLLKCVFSVHYTPKRKHWKLFLSKYVL